MKRLLDYDPLTGIKTYHEYDHLARKMYIHEEQDVSSILDKNKALSNDSGYKQAGIKNDHYHFATIPNVVIMQLKNEYNLDVFDKDDLKKIEKLLNFDPSFKHLKTVNRI
jgi:hypothetical protein